MSKGRNKKYHKPSECGGAFWTNWKYNFYGNEHAPSRWKRDQRRTERTQARQAIREGREPQKYERPYYW